MQFDIIAEISIQRLKLIFYQYSINTLAAKIIERFFEF